MSLTAADVATIRCPTCHARLAFASTGSGDGPIIEEGSLLCAGCQRAWAVRDRVPYLCDEARVSGMDRMLRPLYDIIAPYHDLGVDYLLPVLQFPDVGSPRPRYVKQLELGAVRPHDDGSPVRILEVGIGCGANVPLVTEAMAPGVDVEVWGVDLSSGMLRQASRRLAGTSAGRIRLLIGDAHALPFADATFDRVFHVGGINGYRDIRKGLAEMARVARADTPIVVVDEELDPDRTHTLLHRLAFGSITFFDSAPHAPRELVPAGAYGIAVTHVSRFYYCLTFRVAAEGGASP